VEQAGVALTVAEQQRDAVASELQAEQRLARELHDELAAERRDVGEARAEATALRRERDALKQQLEEALDAEGNLRWELTALRGAHDNLTVQHNHTVTRLTRELGELQFSLTGVTNARDSAWRAAERTARERDEALAQLQETRRALSHVLERLDGLKRTSRVHLLAQPDFPEVVCLCGSTRFGAQFAAENLRLTLEGVIVLSIGANTHSDDELWSDPIEKAAIKTKLDQLHLRKIELSDRVRVVSVDGYLGESTRREIRYALDIGRPVEFLEAAAEVSWRETS
jgi:hypothetical protein